MAGDNFTELLRELKERSGLSYGALGKRLHMSASTLHRYVSGEVVPTEFAPVERLARVCRATPEELLELHRRWIRADALRGVKKAGEAGEAEGPGEHSEPGGHPESGKGRGSGDTSEQGRSPEPGKAPQPGEAPEPAEPREPGEAREPAESQERAEAREPGEALKSTGAVGAADSVLVADAAPVSPASRAPRRRVPRAALYAATGVVAVSAAVALVANLVSGTDGDGRHGPAGAVAPTSAPVSRSAASTGAASPSGSASASASASPSPSAPRSASASAPRPGAAASPSRRAPAAAGPALAVSTTPYFWDVPCDHAFLVDRSPKSVLPPPAQQDSVGWATAYGAVSANRQTVVLTVQGTGPETVVLEDLHVRVVNSMPPLDWNQYVMGNGCGGQVDVAAFDVALDLGKPLAMPIGGQRDFPYSVSESDPEVFHVNAHTSGHDVSWYLELEWSSGGREGTVRVDDHGRPFRTSASKDDSYYAYPLGSDAWELVPGE
ncbi:helix-turn-helix domain-containing protein [Streptomyces sp. BK79]|uniref:helix-turn-helix domain-containing protein n=1 Tax=Streptomyces sp. BK79 TaxID=3350097 RepID=UPI00376FDE7C